MKFAISSVAALVALIGSASAQTKGFDSITVPTNNQVLSTGETLDITWEYDSKDAGKVTIALLQGASQDTLQIGDTIAASVDNSLEHYSWIIGSDVAGYATYGIKISLDSDPDTFQYSFPFQIKSSSRADTGSSDTGSSTTSSSSTSSSASESSVSTTVATTISKPSSGSSASVSVPSPSSTSTVDSGSSETGSDLTTATSSSASAATATGASQTTLSTARSSSTSSATSSSTSATATATSGGGKVAAGAMAAFGGVAAALFAL